MRYAVISDVHSDYQAIINALNDINRHGIDKVICLGDMVGYGYEAEKVVSEIMKRGIASVCGNHEMALFDEEAYEFMNTTAKIGIERSYRELSERSMKYLESLPCVLVENGIRFVHGMPPDSVFKYLHCSSKEIILQSLKIFPEQITFCGHTHKTEIVEISGNSVNRISKIECSKNYPIEQGKRYIINVGSVSIPREGNFDNGVYVIYDTNSNICRFIAF